MLRGELGVKIVITLPNYWYNLYGIIHVARNAIFNILDLFA